MGPEMQVHTTVASPQPAYTDSMSANDMTLEQNMGIDSGTLLGEQHERGRQRPLSEANRRAQEEPGAGGPLSSCKTAVRDYPATKLVFNFGSPGITFTQGSPDS